MAVVAALAGSAAPAGADQVGRDATFADGGVLQVDFDGAIDQAEDLAVLPDGGTVSVTRPTGAERPGYRPPPSRARPPGPGTGS